MRAFPIDQTRVGKMQVIAITPKTDQEGTQRENRDGLPQWTVQALNTPPQAADGYQPKAGLEEVTISAKAAPEVPVMTEVMFPGLIARSWQMGDRSGVSLSADGVQAARRSGGEG